VLAFVKRATPKSKSPAEQFIEQCVVRKAGERIGATALHNAFIAWCEPRKLAATTQKEFGKQLGHAGFGSKKTHGVWVYLDIALAVLEPPPMGTMGDDGDHSPVERLESPRERVNGEIIPIVPDRPHANGTSTPGWTLAPAPIVDCYACKARRYWRLGGGVTWHCGTCQPPSKGLPRVVWSDGEIVGVSDA
jgi:hypothetical protein